MTERTDRHRAAALVGIVWAICAVGCTPALNWRDTLIGESGVRSLFPCHPDVLTRNVRLADTPVEMTLRSCAAEGLQFGIADAALPDGAAAFVAVRQLQQVAASNIGAGTAASAPVMVKGLEVGASAVGLRMAGRRDGQSTVQERAVLFTVGSHALQASVVGDQMDDDAADTFFAGLDVPH